MSQAGSFDGGVQLVWHTTENGVRLACVTWPDGGRHGALGRAAVEGLVGCFTSLASVEASETAVVLTGAGRDFSAGADLRDVLALAGSSEAEREAYSRRVQDLVDALIGLPCLTAVAIEGYALGLGFEMALAADLRWAAADARLGLPEARLGLLPAATGTVRMLETLGPHRGLDWLLEGRIVSAQEAKDAGLLTGVAPEGTVLAAVGAWLREHPFACTLAPKARHVRQARDRAARDAARRAERAAFVSLLGTDAVRARIEARLDGPRDGVERNDTGRMQGT